MPKPSTPKLGDNLGDIPPVTEWKPLTFHKLTESEKLAQMALAKDELKRHWAHEEAEEVEEDRHPWSGWVSVFDHVTPSQWMNMTDESNPFEQVGVLSRYLFYYASTQPLFTAD